MKVLNQEKIALALGRLSSYFEGDSGEGGLVDLIKRCDYEFSEVLKYLPEKEDVSKRLSSVRYELEDLADTIENIKDDLYFDEYSAAENEKRLDTLTSLKKKYGGSIKEINEYLANIKNEYDKLVNSAELVEKLEKEKEQLTKQLDEKAQILSNFRKKYAEKFELAVKNELSELSMKSAKLEIQFSMLSSETCDERGYDDIEFMFTANSGQPLRPLNKVASGGEMSRFMLAVKNITADIDHVDTMIFDEIDTGISGDTANVLAKKLAKIGKNHQVICVTHLAQVASFGTSHFFISKAEENGKTKTSLKLLSDEERVYEIARIIGGTISDFSISHAKLMLEAGKTL